MKNGGRMKALVLNFMDEADPISAAHAWARAQCGIYARTWQLERFEAATVQLVEALVHGREATRDLDHLHMELAA